MMLLFPPEHHTCIAQCVICKRLLTDRKFAKKRKKRKTKLEVRFYATRIPSWVLVVMAVVCWVVGLEHRLDHEEEDGDEDD